MSHPAISITGLGKRYRLGIKEEIPDTLTASLIDVFKKPWKNYQRLRGLSRTNDQGEDNSILWALKDINLDIEQGEVLGIIGANGAGKSTLLKILSRITEPTVGEIAVRGRISSLLEVGTGFHPELSGRENIYLNGSLLGMRKAEINRRFDEIVDFSGVERFIDTPVKRYSSGMYVRLAFAVAAHLEPEILIVDEVLAVGDAHFQKKCLGKMQSISQTGRTVVFVSHAMPTVIRLCTKAILLESGKLIQAGSTHDIVSRYLSQGFGSSAKRNWEDQPIEKRPGNDIARLNKAEVINAEHVIQDHFSVSELIGIRMEFSVLEESTPLLPLIAIFDENQNLIFNALDNSPRWLEKPRKGTYTSTAWIPKNLMNEGTFTVQLMVNTLTTGKTIRHFSVPEALAFQITDPGDGTTAKGTFASRWGGAVSPLLKWEAVELN